MIYLAIVQPNGKETHIKWTSHSDLNKANEEIEIVRNQMLKQNKIPYDCYIYENDIPLHGNKAYELDDVDFNFYEEKTEEQKIQEEKDFANKLRMMAEEIKEKHLKETV